MPPEEADPGDVGWWVIGVYAQLFSQLTYDFPGAFEIAVDLYFPKGLTRERAGQLFGYLATFHRARQEAQSDRHERERERVRK